MRVIATKTGFHGGARIREGQVFEVPKGASGKWFKPFVETSEPVVEVKKAKPHKGKVDNAPTTFSEIAQRDAAALTLKDDEGSGLV